MKFHIRIVLTLICCTAIANLSGTDLMFSLSGKMGIIGPIFGEEFKSESDITSLIFLKGISTDNSYNLIPFLFEDPIPNISEAELMDDGRLKYNIKIRDDIYWQDGSKLTAEDIVFTYKVITNQNVDCSNVRDKIKTISSMSALNQSTLQVIFKGTSDNNWAGFSFRTLPKHAFSVDEQQSYILKADNSFFSSHHKMIGNGFYKPKRIIPDSFIVLSKNENYAFEKPRFETITIEQVETQAVAVTYFKLKNEYNLFIDLPVVEKPEILSRPNLDIVQYYPNNWQFVAFNMRRSIFKDKEFREALTMAIDKNTMNNSIFLGACDPITGPFATTTSAYNLSYDPAYERRGVNSLNAIEKANEQLDALGYLDTDGDTFRERNGHKIELEFVLREGVRDNTRIAQSILSYYNAIGIFLKIVHLNLDQYVSRVYETHDFDLSLNSFTFGSDPDIFPLFSSSEIKPSGYNIFGFENEQIEKDLLEARNKENNIAKMQLYRELHAKIADEYPCIFLWQKPSLIGYDKDDVMGISKQTINPINKFQYINKW